MTIAIDSFLTANAGAAVRAPLRPRNSNHCRLSATSTPYPGRETTQRDTTMPVRQPRQHLPAYYLGRPAQTWIDALAATAKVGSASLASIERGRPT